MFYIFSVEIDELLLAGCITLDFSDISCWWTKSPVQCRVFCLILKLECDACVTKALRADLLRNWIIRAPASVRDHLVTKCHSGDHHHHHHHQRGQWHVTNQRVVWGNYRPIRGRVTLVTASVSHVTSWQWWPVVSTRVQRVSQQLCDAVTRPVTETISADTSDTVKNVIRVVSRCPRALLVSHKHSPADAEECTVTR